MKHCGTWSAYSRGCRCDECRKASSVYRYQRRGHGDERSWAFPCWFCRRSFHSEHGAKTHMGMVH